MRIACIHLPQLSLQCVTRIEPSLRSSALVVVGQGEGKSVLTAPIVVACSRAAWALGVRVGMTATAARAASPDVRVVHADPAVERETIRAVADALLAVTPVIDLGGRIGGAHLAMYVEVPAKTRGTAFGERVVELLAELGLTARVGIADDRFTAWVAAADHTQQRADDRAVVSVPRGGSAAFLAPRPLSLLAIAPEVQHVLEALGVATLGEFAALPAPSVARPIERD
jgi:protein ImuB